MHLLKPEHNGRFIYMYCFRFDIALSFFYCLDTIATWQATEFTGEIMNINQTSPTLQASSKNMKHRYVISIKSVSYIYSFSDKTVN